jgi:uncharacterized protein YndB with AHSA1/START domain
MPQVVRNIEIAVAPSVVWRWLATQEALRRWISPNLEIDLRVGGSYRLLGPDNKTTVVGTVLELVPEGCLVLSWLEEGQGWLHPARLVLSLAASSTGTKVTLIHDGFAGIGKPGWTDTVKDYEKGADIHRILEKLAELLDTYGRP